MDETIKRSPEEEATEATEEKAEKTEKAEPKKLSRELASAKRKLEDAEKALALAAEKEKELADKHLRLAAEYENFRRRATAERTAAYTDGLEGALEKLLPILDNLERASLYSDAEKVAEGLSMTLRAATDALTALGVEIFGEVGDTFDPALHNAVMHVEDEEHTEGEITAVHQKGYKKGDRILRYAMVTVAN